MTTSTGTSYFTRTPGGTLDLRPDPERHLLLPVRWVGLRRRPHGKQWQHRLYKMGARYYDPQITRWRLEFLNWSYVYDVGWALLGGAVGGLMGGLWAAAAGFLGAAIWQLGTDVDHGDLRIYWAGNHPPWW